MQSISNYNGTGISQSRFQMLHLIVMKRASGNETQDGVIGMAPEIHVAAAYQLTNM